MQPAERTPQRYPRRRNLKELAGGFLLASHADVFKSPELQRSLIEPGDAAFSVAGSTFHFHVVKEELDNRGRPIRVRYKIPDFEEWRENVGYERQIKVFTASDLSSIPLKEVPKEERIAQWDGLKRNNKNGGVKIAFFRGLATKSFDNTFDHVKEYIKQLGFDDMDFFDGTYAIDPRKELLGIPYDEEDSLEDPRISFEKMSRLMYLWKEKHPLDKIWLIGHSNGGWEALELAKKHPDAIAGVITLDGALKGANASPFPPQVEAPVARLFRGKAGEFHVQRGGDYLVGYQIERDIAALQKKGIRFVTFSSTNDDVIPYDLSFSDNSDDEFGYQHIDLRFPMGAWLEWDVVKKSLPPPGCKPTDPKCLPIDTGLSPTDSPSAEMIRNPGKYVGNHGAVLEHKRVLEQIRLVLMVSCQNERIKTMRKNVENFIFSLSHYGKNMEIVYSFPKKQTKVEYYNTLGEEEFEKFLRSFDIPASWWIPNLVFNEEGRDTAPDPTYVQEYTDRVRQLRPDTYLINNLPITTSTFSMTKLTDNDGKTRFTVIMKGSDQTKSQQDALGWMHSIKLTDAQIQTLTILYISEAAQKLKDKLPHDGHYFNMSYNLSTDKTLVIIYKKAQAQGEIEFQDYLKQNGVSDKSEINNLTVEYF